MSSGLVCVLVGVEAGGWAAGEGCLLCEKKSAPGLRDDGSDAPVFNYQGVITIRMSHLGVGAQV